WMCPPLAEARRDLSQMAAETGALEEARVERRILDVRGAIPAELREFSCQALRLFAFNRDLGEKLGRFVVRHCRATHHRFVRAGQEVETHNHRDTKRRPDAHLLHAAPGLDVRGDQELPLYLLMRATSELSQGK